MIKRFIIIVVCLCAGGFAFGAGDTSNCSGTGVVFDTDSQSCVCDFGYYGDGTNCTKCPEHKMTLRTGSATVDECLCDKGWGMEEGTCTRCPRHKYKNIVGNVQCVYCPAGEYTNAVGASECSSCPAGYCCAYGEYYACKRGTYGDGGTPCATVHELQEVVIQEGYCIRGGGGVCVAPWSYNPSIYAKGVCTNKCNRGCTTAETGAASNSECSVRTVERFCIGNRCFSWPDEISQSSLNINVSGSNYSCPAGVSQ